jgi:inorganic phosphate transporter, PiT family
MEFFSFVSHLITDYPFVAFIILVAFAFDYTNGMHDAANSIATVVATRVLSPRLAVLWAAFFNFVAVFIVGTAVAKTIGKGMIDISYVTPVVIFAWLLGAISWNLITWWLGLPTSSSHALLGGYLWAALANGGIHAVILSGWTKTIIFIFLAPLMGAFLGFFLLIVAMWIGKNFSLSFMNKASKILQLMSSALYSIWHWANDAQKTMGIIMSLLLSVSLIGKGDPIPMWVIIWAYLAIALGTMTGGWRIVKTMGSKIVKLTPIDGFAAETASAITLFSATALWVPVSTTHTITGAISWVGAAKNARAVKWGMTFRIVWAWIFTIPMACGIAYWLFVIFSFFINK